MFVIANVGFIAALVSEFQFIACFMLSCHFKQTCGDSDEGPLCIFE